MRAWRGLALVCLLLAVATSASLPSHAAAAPQDDGTCKGRCTYVSPTQSTLSRHCFAVGDECATGCHCQDIIGDAHWDPKKEQWVGSFHDCYCVKVGQTEGPKKSCSGYYTWKVHTVKNGDGPGSTLRFDFTYGADAFVHYFDVQDILPSGYLSQSMIVTDSAGGFTGSIVFEDVTEDPTDPIRKLQVQSFGATTGSASLFGYHTGMNYIVPNSDGSLPTATYDTISGRIDANDWTSCSLVNDAFPLGLPVLVELSLRDIGGQWYAYGQCRGDVPVRLTHEYSPADGTLTLTVTGITPGKTAAFYYAAACLGDVDRDRDVDMEDYRAVELAAGRCTEPMGCPEDINLDGVIDDQDLQIVADSIGCTDDGSTSVPGCTRPVMMATPGVLWATANSNETATLVIPVAGLSGSAFYVQAVDAGACGYSNLVRLTIP